MKKKDRKGICLLCKKAVQCQDTSHRPWCPDFERKTGNIGTARKPKYIKPCPFCGEQPEFKPYPNNKGGVVWCNTRNCAAWYSEYDLEEWNHRALPKFVNDILFEIVPYYKSGEFYKTQEYKCKGCGKTAERIEDIKHSKSCPIAKVI